MSKNLYRPGNSAKYSKIEKQQAPNASRKRIRRNKIEEEEITFHFNYFGIVSSLFVWAWAPLSLSWKIGLTVLFLLCSYHINTGEN